MYRSTFTALITCAALLAPANAQQIPLETFAQLPYMDDATLSPDGQHLAFLATFEGQRALAVRDLTSGDDQIVNISDVRPEQIRWAGNDTVIMTASDADNRFTNSNRGTYDMRVVFAFDVEDGLSHRQLLRNSSRTAFSNFTRAPIGLDENGWVLIPAVDEHYNLDLLAADPRGTQSRTVAQGSSTTRAWIVGSDGDVIARSEFSSARDVQTVQRPGTDGDWQDVLETEYFSTVYWIHGELPDGRIAVSASIAPETPDDRNTLFALSPDTGALEVVFEHPQFDVAGTRRDPHTQTVIGVRYLDDFSETLWFDGEIASLQQALDGGFPGMSIEILSWAADRSVYLFTAESGSQAPVYYLFDAAAMGVQPIGSAYGPLGFEGLTTRSRIQFPARDGVTVPAYLTMPEGEGPFPTVVLPHGGPADRDQGGFDYFAHFLASRGYLVVQPNFRGSSGYGLRWENAGYGQWGTGTAQHDVTDSARMLIDSGLADPDRICIVGASYGGYSALAGAAFTPDMYACAAAVAPLADLRFFADYLRDEVGRGSTAYQSFAVYLTADEGSQNERSLREFSPYDNADNITIPVLLVHGREDTVVPVEQSRRMRSALRGARVDVEYVEIENGDHWLTTPAMRREVLQQIETFLAEHIGD